LRASGFMFSFEHLAAQLQQRAYYSCETTGKSDRAHAASA
jgi:hypothetical protein